MEKNKNIFSKIINKIKTFSNKYLEQDIKAVEDISLTLDQRKELAEVQRVEEKIHREKNGFVQQETINEEIAAANAKKKVSRRDTQKVL